MKINLFEKSKSFASDFQPVEIMERLDIVSDSKIKSSIRNQVRFFFSSTHCINFLPTSQGFVVWFKERRIVKGFYVINTTIQIQEKKTIIGTKIYPDFLTRIAIILIVGGLGITLLFSTIYHGINEGFSSFLKHFVIGFLAWCCVGLAFKLVDISEKKRVLIFLEKLANEKNIISSKNKI